MSGNTIDHVSQQWFVNRHFVARETGMRFQSYIIFPDIIIIHVVEHQAPFIRLGHCVSTGLCSYFVVEISVM